MGILDNAKAMAEKVKDNAPSILGKVEGQVEKLEQKGGTVGKLAASSHKVIDKIEEKLPAAKTETTDAATGTTEPPATAPTATPASSTEPAGTVTGADPEGPTEFGTTAE